MTSAAVVAIAVSTVLLTTASTPGPQSPCTPPPLVIPLSERPIYLTERQEVDLGDAIAEHVQRAFPAADADLNAQLQRIGERILAQLPATAIKYRFALVNQPSVNAFALPGGRIYVTRKLVAFTRSEDELAGVLGHEIGHIVTRQTASEMSAVFRDALGVTSFGDRKDVFDKYRQLVESPGPTRARNAKHAERGQYDADRVALMAVARAGYSPAAYVELWDRFTETEQKTGNFLTDLFGATRPESRRLREMLRAMETLPEECRTARGAAAPEEYAAWRRRVIEVSGAGSTKVLRAVARERVLEPPLRSNVTHLKFSPDGRYVLAQDDSSIYVLTREPFAVQFRIDAEDARPAQFTPDSTTLVFHTTGLRVEWWDIATRARTAAHEVVVRDSCLQTALSPDGRIVACFDTEQLLQLIDVPTQSTIYRKDRTYALGLRYGFMPVLGADGLPLAEIGYFNLAFSPDGRYFIAGNSNSDLAVDLTRHEEARLPGSLRSAFRRRFAFLGGDQVAWVDSDQPERSEVLRFPSGETVKTLTLGGRVSSATRGGYLLLRPIRNWAIGVVDVAANKIIFANKSSAFDVYDTLHVSERLNGEIGLYTLGAMRPAAVAALPKALLGRLSASETSSNLKWLAISGRDRGGVWNLDTGARVAHVLGFRGAYVDDGELYVDLPKGSRVNDGKAVEHDRTIVRLDLQRNTTTDHAAIGDEVTIMGGRYLVAMMPAKPNQWDRDVSLEVRDVRSNRVRWTRQFAKQPPTRWHVDSSSARVILQWPVSSSGARLELKDDPRLREVIAAHKLKGGDAFLDVLSLSDGSSVGRLLVNTGKDEWKILRITSSGDVVIVKDRHNQISAYSISTGQRRGSVFGRFAVASAAANLLCVQNQTGTLELFDLTTLERKEEMTLGSDIRLARFSSDGSRLVLLTADQIVREIDTTALWRARTP